MFLSAVLFWTRKYQTEYLGTALTVNVINNAAHTHTEAATTGSGGANILRAAGTKFILQQQVKSKKL